MVAEVEEQRVANMTGGRDGSSWMEWRAVCYSHTRPPGQDFLPPWMGDETHLNWIDAYLDAVGHNLALHPKPQDRRSFDQILLGEDPQEEEPLLPRNTRRSHHAP